MLIEHFKPYKELILRSINSCIRNDQLFCCHDMIDRFKEAFKFHPLPVQERDQAEQELQDAYLSKQTELHI